MSAKRAIDLLTASFGIVVLSPLLIVLAILIKVDSSGPIFFRQVRVGQHGINFYIYKFRTMFADAEKKGIDVSTIDDERITTIGRILRSSKLDELPQLINVISGNMSIVGPRPEVPKYVEKFKEEYDAILKVKPGITDFASLEYRNENELLRGIENPEVVYLEIILPAKIALYRRYLREQSMKTDMMLILKTIYSIVSRS